MTRLIALITATLLCSTAVGHAQSDVTPKKPVGRTRTAPHKSHVATPASGNVDTLRSNLLRGSAGQQEMERRDNALAPSAKPNAEFGSDFKF